MEAKITAEINRRFDEFQCEAKRHEGFSERQFMTETQFQAKNKNSRKIIERSNNLLPPEFYQMTRGEKELYMDRIALRREKRMKWKERRDRIVSDKTLPLCGTIRLLQRLEKMIQEDGLEMTEE